MPDATERKVLIICVFVAGCVALGPMEWVSAGLLIVASGLLSLWNVSISAREEALIKQLSAWAPGPAPEAAEGAAS